MKRKTISTGFTFPYGKEDVFVVTPRKNKTHSLASEILYAMMLPDNPDTRRELLYWLQKATLEQYEDKMVIKGDRFTTIDPEGKTRVMYL